MITSVSNEKVKHVAALQQQARQRAEESLFVLEGGRLFWEAPESLVREVYVTEQFLSRMEGGARHGRPDSRPCDERELNAGILEKLSRTGYELVSEQAFQKMSDTKTPQGVLAVLAQQKYGREELLGASPLLLLLEDVQDPGNLGTMLRTAEGAGASGVILSPGCADICQPKAVRSTMGSLFRVPFFRCADLQEEIKFLRQNNVKVFAACLEDSERYDAASYLGGCAFLIGNEGNGLKKETAMAADARVYIPMAGKLESLNAGVSAAVLLYEAARQRREVAKG